MLPQAFFVIVTASLGEVSRAKVLKFIREGMPTTLQPWKRMSVPLRRTF